MFYKFLIILTIKIIFGLSEEMQNKIYLKLNKNKINGVDKNDTNLIPNNRFKKGVTKIKEYTNLTPNENNYTKKKLTSNVNASVFKKKIYLDKNNHNINNNLKPDIKDSIIDNNINEIINIQNSLNDITINNTKEFDFTRFLSGNVYIDDNSIKGILNFKKDIKIWITNYKYLKDRKLKFNDKYYSVICNEDHDLGQFFEYSKIFFSFSPLKNIIGIHFKIIYNNQICIFLDQYDSIDNYKKYNINLLDDLKSLKESIETLKKKNNYFFEYPINFVYNLSTSKINIYLNYFIKNNIDNNNNNIKDLYELFLKLKYNIKAEKWLDLLYEEKDLEYNNSKKLNKTYLLNIIINTSNNNYDPNEVFNWENLEFNKIILELICN